MIELHEPADNFVQKLELSRDPNEVIEAFLNGVCHALTHQPIFFMQYLPAHKALIITQSAGFPLEEIRGVGVNLAETDQQSLLKQLHHPESLMALKVLMRDGFQTERFEAFPLVVGEQFEGVFVSLAPVPKHGVHGWYWRLFYVHYQNQILRKQMYDVSTRDPLTGLLNKRAFEQHLDHEIKRARRIFSPVSLIFLGIQEEASLPPVHERARVIARLLHKSSRPYDVLAYLEPGLFAMLLPHTPAQGGCIKAERFRRWLLHLENWPTVMGISEYPSFCEDSEGLLRTARDAMDAVSRMGSKKVAVAGAPDGFVADFPLVQRESAKAGV